MPLLKLLQFFQLLALLTKNAEFLVYYEYLTCVGYFNEGVIILYQLITDSYCHLLITIYKSYREAIMDKHMV